MINLLPDIHKKELSAGRTNELLVRYVLVLLGFTVLVAVFAGLIYVYLSSTQASAERSLEENNKSRASLAEEKREIEAFEQNLRIAKTLLDKKIDYSGLVLKYASVIPPRNILKDIRLDTTVTTAPSIIGAGSLSEQDALNLKNNLQASPYFDDVHFESITFNSQSDYPFESVINLTITEELFNE
jgi:hypothetical protein